jgi:NTE family protein
VRELRNIDADGRPLIRVSRGDPLALVLPGGGARAAYQVGVLAGIADKSGDNLSFPIVTGVSAGAINAAALAANCQLPPAELVSLMEQAWLRMSTRKVFRAGLPALATTAMRVAGMVLGGGRLRKLEARGLLDTKPLRHTLAEQFTTEGIDGNLRSGRLRALALSTTSYSTGRTITFVHGQDDVPTWRRAGRVTIRDRITADHVLASCALPIVFPAIAIGDEYHGDGSLRQLTPLSPAIHLGAESILAISVRYRPGLNEEGERSVVGYPPAAQIVGTLFNAVFLDALEADAERVARVNRSLRTLARGTEHPEGLRPVRLGVVRPSRDLGQMAKGLEHHLPGSLRLLVQSLGTRGMSAPDLLSYLLFERPYVESLLELGREDAERQWGTIAPLLER